MSYTKLLLFKYIKDFFTKGHDRSLNAKKNVLVMLLIRGVSMAISFFMVPLTINYINPTRYGVWITLSSIIAWFSFFDIGFGNGLRNKFAEAIAKGENELARIYVSTTYAILCMIIGIVLVLFTFVNPVLDWSKILNTPSEMSGELSTLALIVFVFFSLQFILKLITTVLTSDQQPAKASLFDFLGTLISFVLIFVLTRTTSGNLIYLGIVFSAVPVLVLFLSSVWFYSHKYREYAPSLKFVKFKYAHELMSLGVKFFLIQIAAVVLYQTSNIIIAQLFGPEQVTPYNIAYKYFSIIPMAFGILMMPFWSAFTEAWVKDDIHWIRNTISKLIKIWLFISIGAIIMLALARPVYTLWVGEKIKVPLSLSSVMAIYVIVNGWCGIFSHFLNGVGKIKLQLYSSLICMVVNIPLAVFLGKQIGISGVILATCLLAVTSAIWSPIQYYKIINKNAGGIWNK